jgi:transposase-like protein
MARSSAVRSKCAHPNAVWGGYRDTRLGRKHLRQCPDCGAHFAPDDGFKKMRFPKEVILMAVDLYRQGLSLRKVKFFLAHHHGVKVSEVAIWKWVNKYSELLQKYLAEVKPQIKGTVHLDEKILKVRGKQRRYWGAKDRKTKFRLASNLSETAKNEEAYRLFRRMINGSSGRFRLFVSDKLGAYQQAFNKFFRQASDWRRKGARLNHGVPIGSRKHGLTRNNNTIERDNQRIGRRVVLTRGFKSDRSAWNILQMMDIGYNFLDPHLGLRGRTPADAAGVGIGAEENPLMRLVFLIDHEIRPANLIVS